MNLSYNHLMKTTNYLFLLFTALFFIFKMATAEASYENYYPYYFEYCTGTQVKYQKEYYDGAEGGIGGHGLVYVNGLCKDYSKDYPQVIPCHEVTSNTIPHQGVGISLDSDFKNLTWVAIPGRELTFFGETNPKEINKEDIERIISKATDLKIFENVKMKSVLEMGLTPNTSQFEREVILASIGTNLAVNWGRKLNCVRIPIEKEKLKDASTYLNNLNDSYYKTGKEYKWSMVSNNCTHLAINTSHALGLNKSIKTDKKLIPQQIFNLAVPANAYLMYMDKIILKKKTLGAIANRYDVFPSNVMYKTDELEALTLPRKRIFRMFATPIKYDRYLKEGRYSNIKDNAQAWLNKSLSKKKSSKYYSEDINLALKILENKN